MVISSGEFLPQSNDDGLESGENTVPDASIVNRMTNVASEVELAMLEQTEDLYEILLELFVHEFKKRSSADMVDGLLNILDAKTLDDKFAYIEALCSYDKSIDYNDLLVEAVAKLSELPQ